MIVTFEDTLKYLLIFYQSLFKDRGWVLDHLFCVLGNGYEWVDGCLIDPMLEGGPQAKLANAAAELAKDDAEHKAFLRSINYPKASALRERLTWVTDQIAKVTDPEERALLDDFYESAMHCIKAWEPELVPEPEDLTRRMHTNTCTDVYPLSDYPLGVLHEVPDDIRQDWLDALFEALAMVLNLPDTPPRKHDDHRRKARDESQRVARQIQSRLEARFPDHKARV